MELQSSWSSLLKCFTNIKRQTFLLLVIVLILIIIILNFNIIIGPILIIILKLAHISTSSLTQCRHVFGQGHWMTSWHLLGGGNPFTSVPVSWIGQVKYFHYAHENTNGWKQYYETTTPDPRWSLLWRSPLPILDLVVLSCENPHSHSLVVSHL